MYWWSDRKERSPNTTPARLCTGVSILGTKRMCSDGFRGCPKDMGFPQGTNPKALWQPRKRTHAVHQTQGVCGCPSFEGTFCCWFYREIIGNHRLPRSSISHGDSWFAWRYRRGCSGSSIKPSAGVSLRCFQEKTAAAVLHRYEHRKEMSRPERRACACNESPLTDRSLWVCMASSVESTASQEATCALV